MKPLCSRRPHAAFGRTLPQVCMILAALFAFVGFVQRGMHEPHDRPGGHGDVTFAISPRGDTLVFNAVGEGVLTCTSWTWRPPPGDPDRRDARLRGRPGLLARRTNGSCMRPAGPAIATIILHASLDGKTVKQLTSEDANDAPRRRSPPDGSLIAVHA